VRGAHYIAISTPAAGRALHPQPPSRGLSSAVFPSALRNLAVVPRYSFAFVLVCACGVVALQLRTLPGEQLQPRSEATESADEHALYASQQRTVACGAQTTAWRGDVLVTAAAARIWGVGRFDAVERLSGSRRSAADPLSGRGHGRRVLCTPRRVRNYGQTICPTAVTVAPLPWSGVRSRSKIAVCPVVKVVTPTPIGPLKP
jgi:hypothetical protein